METQLGNSESYIISASGHKKSIFLYFYNADLTFITFLFGSAGDLLLVPAADPGLFRSEQRSGVQLWIRLYDLRIGNRGLVRS